MTDVERVERFQELQEQAAAITLIGRSSERAPGGQLVRNTKKSCPFCGRTSKAQNLAEHMPTCPTYVDEQEVVAQLSCAASA